MTVHGIVLALLLLFPWGVLGVSIVGATLSGVKRNLGHLQRGDGSEGAATSRARPGSRRCAGGLAPRSIGTYRISEAPG